VRVAFQITRPQAVEPEVQGQTKPPRAMHQMTLVLVVAVVVTRVPQVQ